MNNGWPVVPLGELLRHRKEFVQIDDTTTYKRCRVQLHAQGVVLRDEVPGLVIKTKSQQVCRPGEFLVAEIDAKVGGYGLVPSDLDGAIVSSHYFLFQIDETRLERQFLGYFAKTPWFAEQVAAQGTTNYAAIRPSHVLGYRIPLPAIEEQRRVVAHIEAIAARIEGARHLVQQTSEESQSVLLSLHFSCAGERRAKLGQLLGLDEDREAVRVDQEYPQVGIRSFGGGIFAKPPVSGTATTYKWFNRLAPGMVIVSQVKGWEGAIAVCTDEFSGLFASPEYRTFRCVQSGCLPEYMSAIVFTPWFHGLLAQATRGQGARRERTRPEMLTEIEIPMPSVEQQRRTLPVFERLERLRELRETARAELTALLAPVLDRAFKGTL